MAAIRMIGTGVRRYAGYPNTGAIFALAMTTIRILRASVFPNLRNDPTEVACTLPMSALAVCDAFIVTGPREIHTLTLHTPPMSAVVVC